MNDWRLLGELVGLLGLALLLGMLAERLKQRPVLGYLLAGVIAGPKGLALISGRHEVEFLAELGVALLLFSIGLEFSWQRITSMGAKTVYAALLQFGLTWTAGFAAGLALGLPQGGAFVIGSLCALSSTAFVLRMLQDRSEMDSRHGRLAVGILLMQDLLLVPLLVVQSVIAEGREGWDGLAQLGLQLLKGTGLVIVFYVLIRVVLLRVMRGRGSYADREFPILLSFLVCLGCAWATHLASLSPILGAFVAGVLLGDQPVAEQIRANVSGLKAVFITLFFTSIGMLAGIPFGWAAVQVLLIAALLIAGKALMAGLAIRWSGNPWRVAVLGGFAIAQIGEFSFVLANDALKRKVLPEDWFDPLMTASVLTLVGTPYMFSLSGQMVDRYLHRKKKDEEGGEPHPDVDAIVVGYGPAGKEVVNRLVLEGYQVTVVESNPALVANLEGARAMVGDATHWDILRHAGIGSAKIMVVSVPDPGVGRTILALAHHELPEMPVIVRARYQRYAQPLRQLGAETVVDEEEMVGYALARAVSESLSGTAG